MNIWIRNQKKDGLYKVSGFEICDNDVCVITEQSELTTVGEYDTKERCMEILDEIQNLLQPKITIANTFVSQSPSVVQPLIINSNDNTKIEQLNTIVYEMPEE